MMMMNDPHQVKVQNAANVLGVSVDASLEEVKKSFREKAKALHPDTAAAAAAGAKQTQTGDDDGDTTFAELREAYEILVNRAGNASSNDGGASHVYGPGMRARFEAAKKWRERQGATSGPVKAARENTNRGGGDAKRDEGFGFRHPNNGQTPIVDNTRGSTSTADDDDETLEAILRRQKAAYRSSSHPADAARFRNKRFSSASELPSLVTRNAAQVRASKVAAGAVGAALLCTTSCLLYLSSNREV